MKMSRQFLDVKPIQKPKGKFRGEEVQEQVMNTTMLSDGGMIHDFLGKEIEHHPGSYHKPPCPTDQ